jgi:hypothetical protein
MNLDEFVFTYSAERYRIDFVTKFKLKKAYLKYWCIVTLLTMVLNFPISLKAWNILTT